MEPTLVFQKCPISAPTPPLVSSLSLLMKDMGKNALPVAPSSSPTYEEETAMLLVTTTEPLHIQAANHFYKQKKTTRRKVYQQLCK